LRERTLVLVVERSLEISVEERVAARFLKPLQFSLFWTVRPDRVVPSLRRAARIRAIQ
jgi:hypothetical protein